MSVVGTFWILSVGCGIIAVGRYVGIGAAEGWLAGGADASENVVIGISGFELVGEAMGVDVPVLTSRDETVDRYW